MKVKKIHLPTIDSTNTYAKDHARDFAPDGITCILAEEQTSGHGQFGRKWFSPKEVNLYATLYFHLPLKTEKIEELAIFMAKVIKIVLEEQGLSPTLKWPNDVLLNGKKVAGVLCETVFQKDHIQVILGFGLNVNMKKEDLDQIDQKATSLKQETGRVWDKEPLFESILKQFIGDIKDSYHFF